MTGDRDTDGLPLVHESVVHMLAQAIELAPDATALIDGARQLTYREYGRCVGGFARELAGMGGRGGRVATICGNSIEMAIAMFAIHACGAQAVPINPLYTQRELGQILGDADPIAVIYDADVAHRVEGLLAELNISQGIQVSGPHGVQVSGDDGRCLDAWRDDEAMSLSEPYPEARDLATLQYTGGTTGLPKGVNITHGQMAINISQREAFLPTVKDDENIVCVMPMFHVFAVAMCLHLSAYCRGRLVILPRYHPDLIFDAIASHQITRLPAGPTIFNGLMGAQRFSQTDFSNLRTAYSGSAPLPVETLRQWQAATGCPILEGYGQSEAGPVVTYVAEGMAAESGSVGPALPLTEIEIVDVETGTKLLDAGGLGEIRVRGPQIMSGYRNRPEESAEALRDGWLYTGDIGELDGNGHLYIRDRKKDMVITGGYNVYPREVDEVLFAHPDISEAASFGVADDYRGEILKALVVLKPGSTATEDAILLHCASNLAKYKVPTVIELVDEIAKTTVGKVDKKALRG